MDTMKFFNPVEAKAKPSKNLLLLSGSRAAGNLVLAEGQRPPFLGFAIKWIKELFSNAIKSGKPILFVPYALMAGRTEKQYFDFIKQETAHLGMNLICAPSEGITEELLNQVGGIYVGGGHTYTLLDKLQKTGSLALIRKKVEEGLPYLGSSAGTIIACPTIKTTNDMPCPTADFIDLRSLGITPVQLNPHYMDNDMHDIKHMGEKRDTRIREFCHFHPKIPVIGLYEGTALRMNGEEISVLISDQSRKNLAPIFCNNIGTDSKLNEVTRIEVECQFDVPMNISKLLEEIKEPKTAPSLVGTP